MLAASDYKCTKVPIKDGRSINAIGELKDEGMGEQGKERMSG